MILWLGGELNFNVFISFLATVVISILFQIVLPSKDLFIPCIIFIYTIFSLFTSFMSLFSFPPLIVHDPSSNILHSNFPFLEHNYFSLELNFNSQNP